MGALVAGDREINPIKLKNVAGFKSVELAGESIIEEATGGPLGFSGPIGLAIPLFADKDILSMEDFVVGGNEKDVHMTGVNTGRFQGRGLLRPEGRPRRRRVPALRRPPHRDTGHRGGPHIQAGDEIQRGDERDLPRCRRDRTGSCVMGCYGIGVGRTVAAAIEQNHDENGMALPFAIAPFRGGGPARQHVPCREHGNSRRTFTAPFRGRGRYAPRRQGRKAGRQVQGLRPYRHTLARHDRREGPQGRERGYQAARTGKRPSGCEKKTSWGG